MKKFRIIGGGHADLPKELEQRWGTRCVSLEDHDEYLVLRPAPDEGRMPADSHEHLAEEIIAPGLRRGSSGAGY